MLHSAAVNELVHSQMETAIDERERARQGSRTHANEDAVATDEVGALDERPLRFPDAVVLGAKVDEPARQSSKRSHDGPFPDADALQA